MSERALKESNFAPLAKRSVNLGSQAPVNGFAVTILLHQPIVYNFANPGDVT